MGGVAAAAAFMGPAELKVYMVPRIFAARRTAALYPQAVFAPATACQRAAAGHEHQ